MDIITERLKMAYKEILMEENKQLKTCISIFSGVGGWEYGAKQLGIKPIQAFEYEPKYANIYKKSHGDHVVIGDIKTTKDQVLEGSVDILFSSPPCQNYSSAKHKDKKLTDTNVSSCADVGIVTIDFAKKLNTKVILVENVKEYKSSKPFKTIVEALSKDYHISYSLVDASFYNVPSSRKRLICVFLNKNYYDLPYQFRKFNKKSAFPIKSWYEAVKDIIPTLKPASNIPKWQRERIDRWGIDRINFPILVSGNNASTSSFKAGKNVKVFRDYTQPAFTVVKSERAMNMTKIILSKEDYLNNKSLVADPHCFARWQSFPDDLFDNLNSEEKNDYSTLTNIIGNAVPPELCKSLLSDIISL
jgi:DNA-cytosine methyltransferase